MIESPVKFFKNLPKKRCHSCKKPIVEQADCYTNKCEKCNTVV